jgi:hypothetical protein
MAEKRVNPINIFLLFIIDNYSHSHVYCLRLYADKLNK